MTSHDEKSQSQTALNSASNHSMPNENTDINPTLDQDMRLYVEDDHVDSLSLVDSVLIDNGDNDVTDRVTSKSDLDQSGVLPSKVSKKLSIKVCYA